MCASHPAEVSHSLRIVVTSSTVESSRSFADSSSSFGLCGTRCDIRLSMAARMRSSLRFCAGMFASWCGKLCYFLVSLTISLQGRTLFEKGATLDVCCRFVNRWWLAPSNSRDAPTRLSSGGGFQCLIIKSKPFALPDKANSAAPSLPALPACCSSCQRVGPLEVPPSSQARAHMTTPSPHPCDQQSPL